MTLLALSEIQEGMIVANDVEFRGQVIIRKGVRISADHLKKLKAWGIVEISVNNHNSNSNEAISDKEFIELARKKVNSRFIHADLNYAPMKEIYKLAVKRTAKRMQKASK
ncbi:MAG: hypothetical protein OEZ58_16005 [Gammaproteobacteria bacterium]|nr:hypothetical protein [Gammaproteobacteria bacterium]MDH5730497.1 hypothetical protein [Gammaproteobacteria bacterium]